MSLLFSARTGGIDLQQVEAWFEKAEGQLRESVRSRDKAYAIVDEFDEIHTLVKRLDVTVLTARQRRKLLRLLSKSLPKWVALYIATVYAQGSKKAFIDNRVNNKRVRIIKQISSLQANQSMRQLRAGLSFGLEQAAVRQLTSEVQLAFPDFTVFENSILDEPCMELWSNWTSARSRELPAEDQYLIEQIATRYVPDALHLYASVNYHGEGDRAEATELVKQQLELLNEQVAQLLRRHSGDALTALRAHRVHRGHQPPRSAFLHHAAR